MRQILRLFRRADHPEMKFRALRIVELCRRAASGAVDVTPSNQPVAPEKLHFSSPALTVMMGIPPEQTADIQAKLMAGDYTWMTAYNLYVATGGVIRVKGDDVT